MSLVRGQRQEERECLAQVFARKVGHVKLRGIARRFERDISRQLPLDLAQHRCELARMSFDVEAAQLLDRVLPKRGANALSAQDDV